MTTTNGGPLRAPDTMVVFTPSTITIAVGETATINYVSGTAPPSASTLDTLFGGIATTEVDGGGMVGTIVISGVSAGTASIAPSTPLGNGATMSQDGFTLTVTAPVDDDKFLNKRGLTHFWENIDDIKQDKLTAGTNITIAADNTISASQPTVNDATLTIQRNGTNVQTFTANASSNVTADISVPTKTSDLTNDGSDNTAQYLETDETAYRTTSIPYGECDSTSTSTAFTATVPGITELRDGVCMLLKNGVVTSASGFTININGLGAKPAYSNMAAATRETTAFNINYTIMFVYDSDRVEGGCWVYYRGYYSDANSIGYQLRTNSTSLTTTDRTRYYRLLFTSADNTHWVPANTQYDNSATSNKTINQRKINPFGRIVYLGNSTSYLADAAVSATAVWDQYAFNLGYSFSKGSALTMTYPKPVYVKCAPQTDGSAIIDSTTPYVQDLPSTDDGKIYIYLGIAYSATNVEMVINHPVYYYKDGAIREWSNTPAAIASVAWGDITGTLSNQSDLNSALGAKANSADLAAVATSGSYNDLSNKPTIPAAQVNSDWNADSGVAQILNKPTLATVATSGDYDDLINKPAAMTVDSALSWTSQNPVENQAIRKTIYVKNSSDDKEAGINIAFSNPNLNPYVHLGSKTSATKGTNSVGIGNNAEASAIRSVAIGNSATASKREGVALGPNATAGQYSLSIGYYTDTVPNYSTAVGPYAKVLTGATNATAIGYQSEASEAETVSVGKSTKKRRIVNVADGTTATDAATVGQIPTNTSDLTNDSGFIDEVSTITNARIDEIMGVA